ncbi:MAG TPA: S-layer homology domain-containing protein [Candidatus Baltobacteraceae bacterium]|nr:S-layer homology domain-containing protein [Candidatus Baltobacteraceae bacterium]
MNRLGTLVVAASLAVGSLLALGRPATATPFSDVPANHWAYQAIQSLAADGLVEGYPDGKFKGDRPLTRYEMAVIVARVIAKLQANGAGYASKADLDKLQKLMDALKDELDALGVRVTNLEDALDALDKRTKFAQSIRMHGTILDDNSSRQRYGVPQTLAHGAVDPFVDVFISSPADNSPLQQQGAGNLIRYDDKFNFIYTINENLTVSIPVHIVNYGYGGEFTPDAKYSVEPDVLVNVASAGTFGNLYFRDGQLDNMASSRLGLTYRAPDATQQGPGYENPVQPYEKGFEIGGVVAGQATFQFSWTRIDQTMINTLTNVADPNAEFSGNDYFFPVTRPQTSYVQPGAPASSAGALRTDTYTANGGSLGSVYLTREAVPGTVYVSSVDGVSCGANALTPAGGACPIAANGWYFIQQTNQVVFLTPLPAGTTVQITYVGLTYTNNDQYQRYHVNLRVNEKIPFLPGAEVGLSVERIFDFADVSDSEGVDFYQSAPNGNAAGNGLGVVSDTVFGLDAQIPIWFVSLGDRTNHPTLFGEGAVSKYTPDVYDTAAITDSAEVVGLKLRIAQVSATLQYQAVGPNFMVGGPLEYFGPAPATFQWWKGNYFPQFFGFANNVAINKSFDAAVGTHTAASAATTYIYPVFNPFVASGPEYFSAYAPNTQGFTLNVTTPVRLGDLRMQGQLLGQRLRELTPNAMGQLTYGPGFASGTMMEFDKLQGGLQFALPILGQGASLSLSASLERLSRNDRTAYAYVPFNPAEAGPDVAAGAALNAYLATGATPPLFYPNYINDFHNTYEASVTLPVTRDTVLGLAYNKQYFHGAYGTTLGQNIDEEKDQYQGTFTYNIPKTTSSIQALFRNDRYTDTVMPTFNFNQNREDLNFTVRF